MKNRTLIQIVGFLALSGMASHASATAVYSQGFETDTAGWFDQDNGWAGDIERVPSGTNSIPSSAGSYHAMIQQTQVTGIGVTGPYSNFSGLNSNTDWPGGITVSTDIYLDTGWANGSGFDYSTAMSNSSGGHLRDYIFHVTKDSSTGELLVGGSNNTNFDPREDLESNNHYQVNLSGWYTFEHVFRDAGGLLVGDLNLRDSGGNLLFTETRSGADPISNTGGARYSWFTNIDIDGGTAMDNHSLNHASVPAPATLALLGLGLTGLAAVRRKAG